MFLDRNDAGGQLARRLKQYSEKRDGLVIALPRGGVAVAAVIAEQLGLPLDVLIVRKIGHPLQPELAVGALSETGTLELNEAFLSPSAVPHAYIEKEISLQKQEIEKRIGLYRKGKRIQPLEQKTIILVDDGIATGATMKAAIASLRKQKAGRVVIAVPVAPPETAEEMKRAADEFVCIETPRDFLAVGNHYENFAQVSDDEVVTMLQQHAGKGAA